MPHFYRNVIYIAVVFSLIVLMHYLREQSLYLPELLSLGMWFGIGLVSAGLLGSKVVAQTR
jgi:hypothetical protein